MSAQQPAVREFTVRAAGADRSFQRFVLGKFPLGPPELKAAGSSWRKSERDCYVAKPDRNSTRDPEAHAGGKQWVLDDAAGAAVQPVLVGQPEAGMGDGGSGAGYFLLIRHRGSEDFIAMPVAEWQNFKPLVHRATNTLEDAEAEMKRKRLAAERVNPRLAQAVKAAGGGEEGLMVPGDDEEDSDAEWKDIRARAATRQAIKKAPQQKQKRGPSGDGDEEEADPEEAHAEKSDVGEDWEHEDVAADDDLDMGEGEEDAAADMSPVRRRGRGGGPSSDEEENVAPAKVSRALKRMMRQTGLEDSEEEEDESEGEEESESIEDEEDLDRMATGLLPGRARSPSPAAAAAAAAAGGEEAASKKRKAPTPPPAAAAAVAAGARPPAPAGGAAAAEQAAKRARTGGPAAGPGAGAAAATAGGAAPAAGAGVGASPVSEAEVRALLQARGRLPLKDIAQHFKAKLRSPEERNAFTQLVKQIAKLESTPSADGQKYLVLR